MLTTAVGTAAEPRDFDCVRVSVPCMHACPAHTDIPGYLQSISMGDHDQAYRINLRDNVFPGVLGRVCARPCEPVCRHGAKGLGEPVAICSSKRAAADFRAKTGPVVLEKLFVDSGRHVAVVGAGPAGLTVARELTRFGHTVDVFEEDDRPGGLMVQGIPIFRLPRDVIEMEISQLLSMGIRLHVNASVDAGNLLRRHDAVVWATGAQKPVIPNIPGMELNGVGHGLAFLREVNRGRRPALGRRVVVIGGGFTAVDCARMARRMGSDQVSMFYRRSEQEMYITPGEVEAMREEGVVFKSRIMPITICGEGTVRSVVLAHTQPASTDRSGRLDYERVPGSEFEVDADFVLMGTGQQAVLPPGADAAQGPLFLAGDVATGSTSLIHAIGNARECARRVDSFLMGERRLGDVVRIGPIVRGTGRTREMDEIPRQTIRMATFDPEAPEREAEQGLDEQAASIEASRCYQCQYLFEIDNSRCIYCDMCVAVCPVPDCIVRVDQVVRDGQGRWQGFIKAKGLSDYHLLCIDPSLCIRCDLCVKACPVNCIPAKRLDLGLLEREAPALYEEAVTTSQQEISHG